MDMHVNRVCNIVEWILPYKYGAHICEVIVLRVRCLKFSIWRKVDCTIRITAHITKYLFDLMCSLEFSDSVFRWKWRNAFLFSPFSFGSVESVMTGQHFYFEEILGLLQNWPRKSYFIPSLTSLLHSISLCPSLFPKCRFFRPKRCVSFRNKTNNRAHSFNGPHNFSDVLK